MIDPFQEHCDYEANAQFDYISEAYASTALDPFHEGYCDYCSDSEEQGEEPLGFEDWKAREKDRAKAFRSAPIADYTGFEEIPF
jgi:hypothetical protein